MKEYTLKAQNKSVKFKGELLVSEYTCAETVSCYYSGSVGRWNKLKLYQSDKGNYIIAHESLTLWQGGQDEHMIYTGTDIEEMLLEVEDSRCKQWFVKAIIGKEIIKPEEV